MHLEKQAQVRAPLFDEAPIEIPAEYSDYNDVFSVENVAELLENTGMNKHAIELEESKQSSIGSIYSLGPVELEILKTYIETNLINDFICPSKSPVGAPILFDKKPDGSFCLYVNYWSLNNITIKNQYLPPFIRKSLN